jgi:hypothetical protein
MSKSILSSLSVAALAGGAMLALELSPASAFTLSGSSEQSVTSGQVDTVYYRAYRGGYRGRYHGGYAYHGGYGYHGGYAYHGGYGYRPYGYGYHPYGWGGAAAVGAAALGAAAVGAAIAPHCWIDSYGNHVCN